MKSRRSVTSSRRITCSLSPGGWPYPGSKRLWCPAHCFDIRRLAVLWCHLQYGLTKMNGLDAPCSLLKRQVHFHDDHILRPANLHSLLEDLRRTCVCTAERPHPPQVSGEEARHTWVSLGEILRSDNSGPLLRPCTNKTANLKVKLHLRQICCHSCVQCRKHSAVIGWLSDIYGLLLSYTRLSTMFLCELLSTQNVMFKLLKKLLVTVGCSVENLPSLLNSRKGSHADHLRNFFFSTGLF